MLGLGRDLARAVGVERMARLTRIEGGLALRAPGMALVLLDDRLFLAHWARSPEELRAVQDHVTRRLGGAFPIEDIRTFAAPGAAGRADKPKEGEVDRTVPAPAEPDYRFDLDGEDAIPPEAADNDFGPGF